MTILALLCIGYAVEQEAVWPSDAHRFPYSLQDLDSLVPFAREQKEWCETMGHLRLATLLECRLGAWEYLRYIRRGDCSPETIVYYLQLIRELIGRDNYHLGVLPECRIMETP